MTSVPYQHVKILHGGSTPFHYDTIYCTISPYHHYINKYEPAKPYGKGSHKVKIP